MTKKPKGSPRDEVPVHVVFTRSDHDRALKALKKGGGAPLTPYMRLALFEKLRRDGLLED